MGNPDDPIEPSNSSRPQQLVPVPAQSLHHRAQIARADHVSCDPRKARRARVERDVGCIIGYVVFGREIQRLIGIAPVKNPAQLVQDDRRLAGQQIGECAVEYRGRADRRGIDLGLKGAAQVHIAIVTRPRFGEIE